MHVRIYTLLLLFTQVYSQFYLRDQTLGCDGVIGSGVKVDRCGECGGDNSSCRIVSGIFTKRLTVPAYEYITEFPKGATNINITEARNTRNYLALRYSSNNRSIINGNWSLDWSGEHDVAGTKLIYKKPKHHGIGETIYIEGPLQEEIQLLLLVQTRNPGIYYRYAIPLKPANKDPSIPAVSADSNNLGLGGYLRDSLGKGRSNGRSTSSYQWRVITSDQCSLSCGGGYKKVDVVCVLVSPKVTVTEENCKRNQNKPRPPKVSCNNQPCPPEWETGEWSECSATCGRSTQSRQVTCKRRMSANEIVPESAINCDSSRKPSTVRMCPSSQRCYTWQTSQWTECTVRCGAGKKQRSVHCVDAQGSRVADQRCTLDKPRHTERCYSSCERTWFYSDWLNKCSHECGGGNQTRRVFCPADEKPYSTHRPSLCGGVPETNRDCKSRPACETAGEWFTGQWSQCTGNCKEAYQRRHVYCMIRDGDQFTLVTNDNCAENNKPPHKQKCHPAECDRADALWFVTDWSECSVSCGNGYQRRQVKCLNNKYEEERTCLHTVKPTAARVCSKEDCPPSHRYMNSDPSCRDKYRSCQVVVQARLCKLKYYYNICCESCNQSKG